MWHKLDDKKQKIVAIVAAVLVLYVAYVFSFKHAVEAYSLNKSLKKEASLQMEDAAYPHLNKKYNFYQKVLTDYRVKKEEMDTKVWQSVSDMAVSQQVKISYNPMPQVADTASNPTAIHQQQFIFRGSYFNMVKLLDTLSKSEGLGKIAQLTITSPKNEGPKENNQALSMQLGLSAVER